MAPFRYGSEKGGTGSSVGCKGWGGAMISTAAALIQCPPQSELRMEIPRSFRSIDIAKRPPEPQGTCVM
jgi:hypothetical protein